MIAAGLLRMPFRVFMRYDGLSAVLSTLMWLGAGYYFGSLIERGLHTMVLVISILTPVLMISGVLLIGHKISREEDRIEAESENENELFSGYTDENSAYGN